MKSTTVAIVLSSLLSACVPATAGEYAVVDTGQVTCYDDAGPSAPPAAGEPFYGQDAQHDGNRPSYAVSADGLTVHDANTGLTWQKGFAPTKMSYTEALAYPAALNAQAFGGYDDWRLPTIKELYSLIDFRGEDPPPTASGSAGFTPFIDETVFDFAYGDTSSGERIIDSQWATTTLYVGTVMGGDAAMFGVNFADGRIKGYPAYGGPGGVDKTYYVRCCRGNADYGVNDFVDNGDGTITDRATGLMWSQDDSGVGLDWAGALAYAQQANADGRLGYGDWRVPDAKELQSLVDYARSPDTTASAAIAPVFACTPLVNLAGQIDYGYYWSSTTHLSANGSGEQAVYVAFGRGMGQMHGTIMDVHGAGCQRSDPKSGDAADYPLAGMGPQGDVQRVFNFVRLVRDAYTAGNVPGDATGDGAVDLADFAVLKTHFGVTAGADTTSGDFDGDGDVDLADFVILKNNFGA